MTVGASLSSLVATSISMAPPPGTNFGLTKMFLATAKQSWRFLSISLRTSLLAPLNKILQASGSLQSTMKVKYSSPIFLISKVPQFLPTSLSWSSSGLLTILAPETLAIRLLSVFLILLMHATSPFNKNVGQDRKLPFR